MSAYQHNKSLSASLALVKRRSEQLSDKAELLQLLDKLAALPQPLAYRHLPLWLSSAGLVAGALACMALYHYLVELSWLPAIGWGLLGLSLLPLIVIGWRHAGFKKLGRELYWHNALLDNQLQVLPSSRWPDSRSWQSRFTEFDRGNHKREFKQIIAGHYAGTEHQFDYHYWHFHYVDRRTVTSTNSKGHVSTRTQYTHYDRYGLMLPFSYVQSLFICSFTPNGFSGEKYQSDSGRFNKIFKVRAREQMQAARFLKPAVVVALEDLAGQLRQLNLEYSADGMLCLSFADADLLSALPPCGLEQLSLFRQSIEQATTLPKLQQTLACLHQLMRHSDSNF
ncbi:hypothetical protein [Arsukibacterium ikkense]|uniref:hypothetical protein n=1 Tax=Arsukibacterium ikkense TaxID=336831 RepID=UPI00069B90E3|nr:hypothetical protein [Arsukibacterium ikkense]